MSNKRVLGWVLLAASAFFFVNVKADITGRAVGMTLAQNMNGVLSLAFFIAGLLILLADQEQPQNIRREIDDIINSYKKDQITPVEAALRINRAVGIRRVVYASGKRHSVSSSQNTYTIPLRDGEKAVDLVLAEYLVAVFNNPAEAFRNQIEISRKASTKHHTEGFQRLEYDFINKHRKELLERRLVHA